MLPPPPDIPYAMLPPPEELPERKRIASMRGHVYFGTRLLGKVQETPRGQFIATQFVHVFFFPIFPLESYLVTEYHSGKWAGFQIPKNRLSVFVGYLRGLSGWAALSAFWFYNEYLEHRSIEYLSPLYQVLIWIWFGLAAAGLLGLVLSYLSSKITKASPTTQKWITEVLETVNPE